MTLSILSVAAFFLLIFSTGFIYLSAIYPQLYCKYKIGASIVTGYIIFIFCFIIIGSSNTWITLSFTLASSILAFTCSLFFIPENCRIKFTPSRWTRNDIFLLSIISFCFWIFCYFSIGYDELNHFSFASQILRGKFPPSVFAFPEFEAKYHYGWAILLSQLSKISSLSFPVCSDILTLFSLFGCITLVIAFFDKLELSESGKLFGGLLFFLGGGLIALGSKLFLGYYRTGLSLLSMFHQHPWIFGVSLYLMIVNIIANGMDLTLKKNISSFIHLFPLLLLVPIVNATSGPFVLLTILFLAILSFLKLNNKYNILIPIFLLMLLGILLVSWQKVGGMMIAGDVYDKPNFNLSINIFDFKKFIKYEGAYLLLIAPIGFIVFIFSLKKIFNYNIELLNKNLTITFLMAYIIVLFPFPLFLMIPNAAYWDNFCKINYFGILSGWLLLAYILDKEKYLKYGKHTIKGKLLIIFAILVIFNEPIIILSRQIMYNPYQSYFTSISRKSTLLQYVKQNIPVDTNILLLNKKLVKMYDVSRDTNKSKVNLYGYISNNFFDFRCLAYEAGVSVVNFFDYNFLYNTNIEYHLLDIINEAFAGNFSNLKDLKIEYLLCMTEKCPQSLAESLRLKEITLQKESIVEGWQLYRLTYNL